MNCVVPVILLHVDYDEECIPWFADTRCSCDERGSVANTQCDSSEQCQCKVSVCTSV